MPEQIRSLIQNISTLEPEVIKEKDVPFEYWGATPLEARKAAVAKKKGLHDKRTTLSEAVNRFVKDGISIGIGGFVNTRIPVAIIHEIIRKGAKDLTLAFQSNSICCELLAAASMIYPDHISVKRVELAWWGYEVIGIAPIFRHMVSRGDIQVDDYTNYGMSARFKAGAMGIPFIPTKDHGGSDMELVNRGKMIKCPFSGDNTYLVPACNPDLALIHVPVSDMHGNARIFGALCTCPEIAQASKHCIMTAEQIIPNENIRRYPNLTEIPYMTVDAVVEQPFGGYPGACYGYYWFDMPEILKFRSVCDEFRKTGSTDSLKKYFDQYVFGCETYDDFLSTRPYSKFKELQQGDGIQPIIID